MGMILHDWNLEKKMKLVRAVYEALPPGGAFIAVEALIDNARRENVFGLLMSLNMLIEFSDAFDYSAADFEKWCREVGSSALKSSILPARRVPQLSTSRAAIIRGRAEGERDRYWYGGPRRVGTRRMSGAQRGGRPTVQNVHCELSDFLSPFLIS